MKPMADLSDDEFADLVRLAVALPDAPPELIQSVIDAGAAQLQVAADAPARPQPLLEVAQSFVKVLQAVLTFDSWAAAPLAMGMRSAGADTRHLLFSSQGRDIDLRVAPDSQRFALLGQVLGPDEAGVVEVSVPSDADGLARHRAPLDAMGEFRISGVDEGTYVVTLRMGGDVIVLPPIDVGSRNS